MGYKTSCLRVIALTLLGGGLLIRPKHKKTYLTRSVWPEALPLWYPIGPLYGYFGKPPVPLGFFGF